MKNEDDFSSEKNRDALWETIRELSAIGYPGMMTLNILRENQPQTFSGLKKKTALPKGMLRKILDQLSNNKLVIEEAGDIALTNYGVIILGVLDKLLEDKKFLIELRKKMEQSKT